MFACYRTTLQTRLKRLTHIYRKTCRPCSRATNDIYTLGQSEASKILCDVSSKRNESLVLDEQSSGMAVTSAKQYWTVKLMESNVPEPEASIDHILSHVLGLKNIGSLRRIGNRILTHDENVRLQEMAALRLKRMPVQYILGEWDFGSLTLRMCHSPSVFIPRPETEELVEIASEYIDSDSISKCLEIGCGSGAVSLGLLSKHPKLTCTAIDANPAAVNLTRTNAEILGLSNRISVFNAMVGNELQQLDVPIFESLHQEYDLLVSNPPYIPTSEIDQLSPEVSQYEDHLALDGGLDGSLIIKAILNQAPSKWLKKGSFIFLEIDPRQVETIRRIVQENGSYRGDISVRKDCFGVDRFVILRCD